MNAFAAERAVEWTYRIKAYGGSFVEVVHDGVHDGTAHVTLTVGGQVAKLDRVLDGKAFFEGNAAGLTYFADLKAADSKLEAGKWVYVPKDSLFFASYANGLTMSSAVQQLYLGGTVTSLPPKTLSGRKVLEVHEALKSKGTTYSMDVYIRASGRPLPVEAVLTVNGVPATIAFGPWGVPPTAKVPKGAVPFRAVWVSGT
ncbi:MAG TPA: hypothetical protein VL984_11870 [Acidimicrobiales bacterium]|nr:hypothetical protein [Acidimicrobiales bacterium]